MTKQKEKSTIHLATRLKNKLTENKGISTTTIGFGKLLLIISIFYSIFTITTIITLITNSRDLIEDATVETIQRNYAKLYHTSRESYSGGYRPSTVGFYESYINDETSIIDNLTKNDKLTLVEQKLVKVDKNNQKLYSIADIRLEVNNEPLQSGTQKFNIKVDYTFEYPIVFWSKEYSLKVPITVQAKHTAKF